MEGHLPDVTGQSTRLIQAFREHFTARGFGEGTRIPLVSRHDPTIRFTNSAISVFKPLITRSASERLFLIQPALRLRNLSHWQRHGSMSGYGCYLIALGALDRPGSLADSHASFFSFARDRLGVAPQRLLFRASSLDEDIVAALTRRGIPHVLDDCEESRYRHQFGLPGITGRNSNLAVRTSVGFTDVGNVISIERESGEQVAVEIALSVSNLLCRVHDLTHPLLASAVSAALQVHPGGLMFLDALGSAVPLVMEHLEPTSRGRGGNLRALLKVLISQCTADGIDESTLLACIRVAAEAEVAIRQHVSPAAGALADRSASDVTAAMAAQLERMRATGH